VRADDGGPRTVRWYSRAIVLTLTLVLGASDASWAAEIEGVKYLDRVVVGNTALVLYGVGLARYLRTIKVYVGALYLAEGVRAEQVLSDVSKRLELSYFRDIAGPDFGKAADQVLAENFPPSVIEPLRPRITRLHTLYQDIKPGDRYALTYLPGVGTELALNGQPKGVIEGADFAAAYFAIWLGKNPISEGLKAQMLKTP
jgi:hypothetical protein